MTISNAIKFKMQWHERHERTIWHSLIKTENIHSVSTDMSLKEKRNA